jgi:hypothetical protein
VARALAGALYTLTPIMSWQPGGQGQSPHHTPRHNGLPRQWRRRRGATFHEVDLFYEKGRPPNCLRRPCGISSVRAPCYSARTSPRRLYQHPVPTPRPSAGPHWSAGGLLGAQSKLASICPGQPKQRAAMKGEVLGAVLKWVARGPPLRTGASAGPWSAWKVPGRRPKGCPRSAPAVCL